MVKLKKYLNKGLTEAGCDEAGRGCLAGPVFAAAVILPENFYLPLLDDSKKLSKRIRYELRDEIVAIAESWAVACVDNKTIDKINILNASILAMHKAIEKLYVEPGFLLIDGNRFKPYKSISYNCIIKGDGKYSAIAAASILAKTYRDDFMEKIHKKFPEYDWANNKGYPTAKHRHAIFEMGITPYHRKTFRLLNNQMRIDL
ncbi:MAG: ribonuclease HII [Bacteroidetes bacterium]|nr:ribonuclease HII [Bacteroidota bacterium]